RSLQRDRFSNDSDDLFRDVDANIQRCRDRIEDGIMPQWWERKLDRYLNIGEHANKAKASERRVSAGQLLSSLVGKPIQFSWKDFDKYNKQADDLVWVEGANGPGAMPMWAYNSPGYTKKYAVNHLYTQNYHEVEFSVKIPGANDNESTVLPFVYDTGCSICRLYEEDLQVIVDMAGQSAPFFCYIGVQSSQGHYTVVSTCKLAFNIHDQSWKNQGNWPRPWVEVQCSVDPGKAPTGWHLRLDEPWLRDLYYIATAPDNNHTL
ncbi:hypothetical protein N7492_010324, partial [Penicillium capsulatum]